ncbi:LysR family transcriptional regulator [Pontibacterium granulatum]|uniref:LysR family transcriptional regulator n=1 Tax=Pontibacterium granulatum TaxID=2036029 RepID=UPI00249C71E0|nr:LysR family transcriptional regulator [Pontibacterium granulatum]MDI3324771.1 LysR family transcriptional regulator [Pontibacterium granulatum]
MNIENLRAFLEVTATGSFQKASENLHITQSTVSARIKALEERLNRELFTRKRDGVALNNGGKAFYPYALSVVKTWQQAQQEVSLPPGVEGIVSLGIPVHYWNKLYSDWLDWMNENAPGIATRIQSDYSVFLLNEMRDGLLDLALIFEPMHSPGLHMEPLFEEPLILVSTEPRTVGSGHTEGYIYIDWGHQFQEQHNHEYPDVPHHRITLALEYQALEQMLERGGSAYLAHSTVQKYLEEGKLFRVEGAREFKLTIYLAVADARRNDPAVLQAIEGLRATRFVGEYGV